MTTNISDRDRAALKAMEDQAKATSVPEGTTIDPTKQTVESDEILGISGKKISDPANIVTPPEIQTQDVSVPTRFDAATYQARDTVPDLTQAESAKTTEEARERATVQAAQGTVSPEALATAATKELDPRATTRYQLAELFKGIEEGGPPPAWAAPAVRKVTAVMQQRGLGSSSMAAAATMQAMMESGIPIAAQDAQKYANIQLQNLNNEQAAALQNAAAMLQMDTANLNNRQQAALNNAKSFLSLDVQDLTSEQQSNSLTYQSRTQALLADAAASNAANQFNAKSQTQVDEFFTELGTQIESNNIARDIALKQFNSNQRIALEQFNNQMDTVAEQFNANMQREIDQSNVVWRRSINTQNTAAQNEANRQNAINLLGIQQNALNNLWQKYRDKAAWVVKISENAEDRAHNAAMQAAAISANADSYDESRDDFLKIGIIDKIWR
jgi:predicted amidophosphoribosyltransferase